MTIEELREWAAKATMHEIELAQITLEDAKFFRRTEEPVKRGRPKGSRTKKTVTATSNET